MQRSFSIKASQVEEQWFVVDAQGKTLGRLASQIAYVLRGKHKPTFTPHMEMGGKVIVINAEKVVLTKNKELTKKYYHHTGYFGGIKSETVAELRASKPIAIIERAVKGMLPHNRLGNAVFQNLKVYVGSEHPHGAQKPEQLPERTVAY